jgi:hypothetical protein
MKFDYSPLPSITSRKIFAPIIPVVFSYKKKEFPTFALVDSGAAGASISTVVAEELGIDWQAIPVSGGFTVSGTFRTHIIDKIEATIGDNSFSLQLNIIEGISPYHCILGQKDIFQKAKIIFEGYNKKFEIIFRQYN